MATTNDPISDFLARMRNAALARHSSLRVPKSKMILSIAQILEREGYVNGVEAIDEDGPRGSVLVHLRYLQGNESAIHELRRVSKPSRRAYVGSAEIPRVKNGLGVAILSTSRGVMTGKDAREQNVGGELLCTVW
jgi:small subunit ribosomal protein S8